MGGQPLADRIELSSSLNSHVLTDLISNQPYSVWVTAATSVGEGPASSVITETPYRGDRQGLPAMISSISSIVRVATGETVRLECNCIGDPVPVIRWSHK